MSKKLHTCITRGRCIFAKPEFVLFSHLTKYRSWMSGTGQKATARNGSCMQCGVLVLGTRAEKSCLWNRIVVVQSSRCFANSSEDSLADQWAGIFTHFKCFSSANIRWERDLNLEKSSERIGYHDETRVVSRNGKASSVS